MIVLSALRVSRDFIGASSDGGCPFGETNDANATKEDCHARWCEFYNLKRMENVIKS